MAEAYRQFFNRLYESQPGSNADQCYAGSEDGEEAKSANPYNNRGIRIACKGHCRGTERECRVKRERLIYTSFVRASDVLERHDPGWPLRPVEIMSQRPVATNDKSVEAVPNSEWVYRSELPVGSFEERTLCGFAGRCSKGVIANECDDDVKRRISDIERENGTIIEEGAALLNSLLPEGFHTQPKWSGLQDAFRLARIAVGWLVGCRNYLYGEWPTGSQESIASGRVVRINRGRLSTTTTGRLGRWKRDGRPSCDDVVWREFVRQREFPVSLTSRVVATGVLCLAYTCTPFNGRDAAFVALCSTMFLPEYSADKVEITHASYSTKEILLEELSGAIKDEALRPRAYCAMLGGVYCSLKRDFEDKVIAERTRVEMDRIIMPNRDIFHIWQSYDQGLPDYMFDGLCTFEAIQDVATTSYIHDYMDVGNDIITGEIGSSTLVLTAGDVRYNSIVDVGIRLTMVINHMLIERGKSACSNLVAATFCWHMVNGRHCPMVALLNGRPDVLQLRLAERGPVGGVIYGQAAAFDKLWDYNVDRIGYADTSNSNEMWQTYLELEKNIKEAVKTVEFQIGYIRLEDGRWRSAARQLREAGLESGLICGPYTATLLNGPPGKTRELVGDLFHALIVAPALAAYSGIPDEATGLHGAIAWVKMCIDGGVAQDDVAEVLRECLLLFLNYYKLHIIIALGTLRMETAGEAVAGYDRLVVGTDGRVRSVYGEELRMVKDVCKY
ncbi:uncharacterized protein VTP21DRAFT_4776 [Calcarisporiella thermophila]|uniref:uncharacterized protein n=1 Tax=Calcarisporiella thermophila TaxID=911321 RepID=UPI0037422AAB